eukprot:jgi/Orpsp1_1/1177027/evm.model.c7180000059890.1
MFIDEDKIIKEIFNSKEKTKINKKIYDVSEDKIINEIYDSIDNKKREIKRKTITIKFLKWIIISLVSLIAILLFVRAIGQVINNKTPDGGINES